MLYLIMVKDRPGTDTLRMCHPDAHLIHFRAHQDRIALAGPLSGDDGSAVGSLVIIDAASQADARAFICADPFHHAGVWEDPVIARIKPSIFAPEKFG